MQQKMLDFIGASCNIASIGRLDKWVDQANRKMRHFQFYVAPIIAMLFSSVVFAQQFQRPAAESKRSFAQISGTLGQSKYAQDSRAMSKIAGQVAPTIAKSIVSIESGSRQIALGTIVSSEGHILTKAGSLKTNANIVFAGQEHAAQLLGIHRGTDLAMLKIDASDLLAVELAQTDELQHGSWLISYGPGNEPVAMGVIAAQPKKHVAALGVALAEGKTKGVLIRSVIRGSAADRSNLWVNDVIRSIDGSEVTSIARLKTLLGKRKPYDQIKVSILRGDQALTVPIELTESFSPTATRRRHYFERALEHDSKLGSNQCGGPLLNLKGQIVGINVLSPSRIPSGRGWPEDSDTNLAMAIPIQMVIPIIESLKSGKLAPAAVNQARIALLVREVAEMRSSISELGKQEDELTVRIEELQKFIQRH